MLRHRRSGTHAIIFMQIKCRLKHSDGISKQVPYDYDTEPVFIADYQPALISIQGTLSSLKNKHKAPA